MDHERDIPRDLDVSPVRTAVDVLASLARSRADIAAGRVEEVDIDALCHEIDAEADAIEGQQQAPAAPSAA